MILKNKYLLVLLLVINTTFAQEEKLSMDDFSSSANKAVFNPISPSKAAFYSAVIPGLGQAYNKRYWKIPIIYGALATSMYYYSTNNTEFKRYRTAFLQRKSGETDEFANVFSDRGLENAQSILRKNRDSSLLTFAGLYALQILEASIDAHLLQFDVSDDVTFDPKLIQENNTNKQYVGLSFNIKF